MSDATRRRRGRFCHLVAREIKDLWYARAMLLFLIIQSAILGFGLSSAIRLYSTASAAAQDNPLYASGFEPVPGIFSPTLGGLFVLYTLFLPVVIIPLISKDKTLNTQALLLQAPFSHGAILAAKLLAGLHLLLVSLLLTLPAPLIWRLLGGHLPWAELLLIETGYLLYGALVVTVSLLSACLFNSAAGATLCSIVLLTFSWVIDFARDMHVSSLWRSGTMDCYCCVGFF